MALVIDTASSSQALGGEALRAWAAGHRVFISSEMRELTAERATVAAALRGLGLRVVMFEDLGGRDENAERAYLDGVASSDVYIGIVGNRYGTMLSSGRSPTHEEYLEARRRGKRISVWVERAGDARQGNARDFVEEVRTFHTTGGFADADDLAARVTERIAEIAADDESPWVKVGDAVFRANTIRDTSNRIEIDATVRDERVARYLEGLRSDRWGRSDHVTVTTSDRAGEATVEEVVSETRARSQRQISVHAEVVWADGSGSSMDAGAQGFSAEDLTELGLRAGLFGEEPPERLGMLDFMLDQNDPLAGLGAEHLPEGSVEPIARLMIVERLIGGRKASTIDDFEIGPVHNGERRVRLAYTEPRRYTNAEPGQRLIEGSWPGA